MNKKQFQSPLASGGVNSEEAQHLRSLDKKIRKKWNQIYYYRKGRIGQLNEDSIMGSRLQTEPVQATPSKQQMNPHQVHLIRSNKNRELTYQRIRRNNDIFFGKRNNCVNSTSQKLKYNSVSQKKISEFNLGDNKEASLVSSKSQARQLKLPLMLQKRGKKIQKEMGIIEHLCNQSVKTINKREQLKLEQKRQEQQKLINKMKGTKLYYKFIQEWKMPIYEDTSQPSYSQNI